MIDIANTLGIELVPRICVIGVGGGGSNAVANMIGDGVQGIEFVVANTDAQALNASPAQNRIQLGRATTQGLGAGAVAAIGCAAALEAIDAINVALDGIHLCFVAAGMGGGTGTGAAPVIAQAARARGILTVGVVTKPFAFEGRRRSVAAEEGIEALRQHVDTLIVIPNQNLFRVATPSTTIRDAFKMADAVLEQGVRSITDLIVMPGVINLDFADVRSVMAAMGKAMLGTGEASGPDRAIHAAEMAIANPLLDGNINGAKGLIISIVGGEDMRLMEVDEAASHIKNLVDPEADIIWGSALDPAMEGRMRVSIVATGIETEADGTDVPSTATIRRQPPLLAASVGQDHAAEAEKGRLTSPPPLVLRPHLDLRVRAAAQVSPRHAVALAVVAGVEAPNAIGLTDLNACNDELRLTRTDIVEEAPAASAPEISADTSSVAIPATLPEAEDTPPVLSLFQRMAMLARVGAQHAELEPSTPESDEPGVYRRRLVGRAH